MSLSRTELIGEQSVDLRPNNRYTESCGVFFCTEYIYQAGLKQRLRNAAPVPSVCTSRCILQHSRLVIAAIGKGLSSLGNLADALGGILKTLRSASLETADHADP